jgi:uncharacterized protein (TIGR00730 family)
MSQSSEVFMNLDLAVLPSPGLAAAPPKSLSVCIFCGASAGKKNVFEQQTRAAVRFLVSRGHRIVYGGAKNGLMGVMADEAISLGGTVVGVIPRVLVSKELLHKGLSEIHVVESMHDRKKKMSDLAEAFLALPGGTGTLEEILEQSTWTQLGIHAKPCGVFDVNGYFAPLRKMVDSMVEEGFMHERHRASLIFGSAIEDVVDGLQTFMPPAPKYDAAEPVIALPAVSVV